MSIVKKQTHFTIQKCWMHIKELVNIQKLEHLARNLTLQVQIMCLKTWKRLKNGN